MEDLFLDFCRYYINGGTKEELDNLRSLAKNDFKEYQHKAQKFAKNLKRKAEKLGFKTDFESFCNMLEKYINTKDSLNDEDKKVYLKVLVNLSNIHDINLREELERYVSYKEPTELDDERYIFREFCRYNLKEKTNPEDFNKIKNLATKNKLNFQEINEESLMFIEEIKDLTSKLGYDTTLDSLYKMVDEYLIKKVKMTDYEKAKYLRILLYLSDIYEVDLRSLLTTKKVVNNELNPTMEDLISNLSNPLDELDILNEMLNRRYNEGRFDILNINNHNYLNETFDYLKLKANLTYRLYAIFLDKFNNYAYDDLNPRYTSLIAEEDISILNNITEQDIYNILTEMNNHESIHYICKKYNLTNNLYEFISSSTKDTLDINEPLIGSETKNLFNVPNTNLDITIYINGPLKETTLILMGYIKECVTKNINYTLDATNLESTGYTLLYASKQDILTKLNILDNIFNNHKEYNNLFNKPSCLAANIESTKYGLSSIGIKTNDELIPYHKLIDNLSEIAYYRVLAKVVIGEVKDNKAINILNDFINFKKIDFTNLSYNNLLEAKYNNTSFNDIKDLINQYIPLVIDTITIYMTKNEEHEVFITEFRKALLYLYNITFNLPLKNASNIAINKIVNQ